MAGSELGSKECAHHIGLGIKLSMVFLAFVSLWDVAEDELLPSK